MSCLPLPDPTLPTLPDGITLEPELPDLIGSPELCCKLTSFPFVTPPLPAPVGIVNPALAQLIAGAMTSLKAYVDALPLRCPKDE